MNLPPNILERSGTALTPGSLMTRFKDWFPRAPLDLEMIKCTPHGCTDSRLSQASRPALHQRRRSNEWRQKDKEKEENKEKSI